MSIQNVNAGRKVKEDEKQLTMFFDNVEQFLYFYDHFVIRQKRLEEGFGAVFNKEVDENGRQQNSDRDSRQRDEQVVRQGNC